MSEEEQDKPQPLDYARPPPPASDVGVVVGTAIATMVVGTVVTAVLHVSSISFSIGGPPDPAVMSRLSAAGLLLAWIALASCIAIWLGRSEKLKPRAIGVWIGLGMTLLIAGACFGGVLK